MRITKTITESVTYYECEPQPNVILFAFTKRQLYIDLFKIYSISLFNPLNLN